MLSDLRASLRRLRANHSFGTVRVFAGCDDSDRDSEMMAVTNDNYTRDNCKSNNVFLWILYM